MRNSPASALSMRRQTFRAGENVAVYSNRLEIILPGRLPNGKTPDRIRFGTRSARNQLLQDVMRDYRNLEHMGMGIPRIIIRGMREHNGTEPDLVEFDERFIFRLFARGPEQQPACSAELRLRRVDTPPGQMRVNRNVGEASAPVPRVAAARANAPSSVVEARVRGCSSLQSRFDHGTLDARAVWRATPAAGGGPEGNATRGQRLPGGRGCSANRCGRHDASESLMARDTALMDSCRSPLRGWRRVSVGLAVIDDIAEREPA